MTQAGLSNHRAGGGASDSAAQAHDEADILTIVTRQIAAGPTTQPRFVAQSVLSALSQHGYLIVHRNPTKDWPSDYVGNQEGHRA